MRRFLVSLAAVSLLVPHTSPALCAQADPRAEKIKHDVTKIGVAQKITVFLKNGDALHGAVTRIDAASFEIAEVDLRRTETVAYADVKKIRGGYGGINLFTGQRAHPPRGVRIAATVGAFFLAVGLPIILLATAKD